MEKSGKKSTVVLVAFYNVKALGVRYLESALEREGYNVVTVFYKDFNSVRPQPTNDTELKLLCDIVEKEKPLFIGYSVMSSMYLETVYKVISAVKTRCPDIISVSGGAFASMLPERLLSNGVDYVIRTDGEIPICKLAGALASGNSPKDIPSLCYTENGENVFNPIGDILTEIDGYGLPAIECRRPYYIENSSIGNYDPQLSTVSYEVIASRGCPFTCSYCCCENLHRLFPKGTQYVRTRSVKSVIDELKIVKQKFKKLVYVRFYDEIFPNQHGWIDEFAAEYKKYINLPFTILSHPKMVNTEELKKLVAVGLTEVTVGVQSGSEHIRRDIFHRYETQEDIIGSTATIHASGVPWANYDFMLQHPFESIEDLKQTYFLVKKMTMPFELQLHGLNFLPGTDIVDMAIEQGIVSEEKMDSIMYAPMDEQFGAYWKQENDPLSQIWYRMTYCLQFPSLRKKVVAFEENPTEHTDEINSLFAKGQKLYKIRYAWRKGNLIRKKYVMKFKK